MIQTIYKKFPKFIEIMKNRHERYNQTVELIQQLEKENKIFVLRPSGYIHLKTIERNPNDLQQVYDMGRKQCKEQLNDLRKYLEE